MAEEVHVEWDVDSNHCTPPSYLHHKYWLHSQMQSMAESIPEHLSDVEEEVDEDEESRAKTVSKYDYLAFPFPSSVDSPTKVSEFDGCFSQDWFPQDAFHPSIYTPLEGSVDHAVDETDGEFNKSTDAIASTVDDQVDKPFNLEAIKSRRRDVAKRLLQRMTTVTCDEDLPESVSSEDSRKGLFPCETKTSSDDSKPSSQSIDVASSGDQELIAVEVNGKLASSANREARNTLGYVTRSDRASIIIGKRGLRHNSKNRLQDEVKLPPTIGAVELQRTKEGVGTTTDVVQQSNESARDIAEKVSKWKRFRSECKRASFRDHQSNLMPCQNEATVDAVCTSIVHKRPSLLHATREVPPNKGNKRNEEEDVFSGIYSDDSGKHKSNNHDDENSSHLEEISEDFSDAPTPKRRQQKRSHQDPNDSLQFLYDDESTSTLTLFIDHYGPTAFRNLAESLMFNDRVSDLRIFRRWDDSIEMKRDEAEIHLLFRAIRSLPRLESLQLANFGKGELDSVSVSAWHNASLKKLKIHVCKGAISNRLLETLAGMPALKELVLEMNETFPLYLLLASTTLESLTVAANNYRIANLHLTKAFHHLGKNISLKVLTMEPPIDMRSFKFLAYSLRDNIELEELKVHVLAGNRHESGGAANEIARMLQSNSSLKKLWNLNFANVHLPENSCKLLLTAFAENTTVEEFLFFEEQPTFRVRKQRFLKRNQGYLTDNLADFFGCRELVGKSDSHGGEDTVLGSLVHNYSTIGKNLFAAGENIMAQGDRMAVGVAAVVEMFTITFNAR